MAKAQLSPGMQIDGFLIQDRLHRGGMADIWRVSRADFDVPIVMKAPFLDKKGELSLLVGFEVEQMIMGELQGRHVPRLLASGDFVVQPYVVMEYLDGTSLQKRIHGDKPGIDQAIAYGTAIAEALGDLHQQHVLHLDLKPANVLFRPNGDAVLIDFGLSRHEHLPDLLQEQFHKPTGTVEYMAPEQFLRIRSDKRSDLFALGAIIYQMATGQLPFGAPGRMAQVRQRVWRDPVPPRAIDPEVSPALQEVILKCIEPLPDRRYKTAEELAFDLRHLDLVELTERAGRIQRADRRTTFGRWLRVRSTLSEIQASATKPQPRAPIILVAVDLRPGFEELWQALLDSTVSVLANIPGARIACLNVMQTSLLAIDENVDAKGDNIHVNRLAMLRHWAEPLHLPRAKITYHLLEQRSIAAGILDFAKSNSVDHLIIGAPAGSGVTGSRLPAQVMSEAPCTVTVVRPSPNAATAASI
jgi:serine/threonine protein kinase